MNLEGMSLTQRILLAIAIVGGIVLLLLLLSWFTAEAQPRLTDQVLYEDVAPDAELLAVDKQALKDAYHDQLVHLFNIWLKGQAMSNREITNGIRIARKAYEAAARQIAEREKALPR